jgi:TRAP-type C4-dicarboxylate transport system permease small subunit
MITFANRITQFARIVSGIIGLAALLLLCFEVVARYFAPHILPDWGGEVVIYLTVWAMFLVVGELALNGGHVHADFVVDRLGPQPRWALGLLASFIGLVFSILFLWYGYEVVDFAHLIGEEGDSSLRFPKWIYYLALPTGMALQCLGYAIRMWAEFTDPGSMTRVSHTPAMED